MPIGSALLGQAVENMTPPPSQYANVGQVLSQLMQTHLGMAAESRQANRENEQAKLKAGLEQRKDTMSILGDELKSMRTTLAGITDPNDPLRKQLETKVSAYEKALSEIMGVNVEIPKEKIGFTPLNAKAILKKAGNLQDFVKSILGSEDIDDEAKTLYIDWAKKEARRQQTWAAAPGQALQAATATAAQAFPGALQTTPGMGMVGMAGKALLNSSNRRAVGRAATQGVKTGVGTAGRSLLGMI